MPEEVPKTPRRDAPEPAPIDADDSPEDVITSPQTPDAKRRPPSSLPK